MHRTGTSKSKGKHAYAAEDVRRWEDYLRDVSSTGPRWAKYVEDVRKKYPNNIFNVYNETLQTVNTEKQRREEKVKWIAEKEREDAIRASKANTERDKERMDIDEPDKVVSHGSVSSLSKSNSTSASQESLKQTSLPQYLPSVKRYQTTTSTSKPTSSASRQINRSSTSAATFGRTAHDEHSPMINGQESRVSIQNDTQNQASSHTVISLSSDDSDDSDVQYAPSTIIGRGTIEAAERGDTKPSYSEREGSVELEVAPTRRSNMKVETVYAPLTETAHKITAEDASDSGFADYAPRASQVGRAVSIGLRKQEDTSLAQTHPSLDLANAIDSLCNGGRPTDWTSVTSGKQLTPLPLDEDGFIDNDCFDGVLNELRQAPSISSTVLRGIYDQVFGTPSRLANPYMPLSSASTSHSSFSDITETLRQTEISGSSSSTPINAESLRKPSVLHTIQPSIQSSTSQLKPQMADETDFEMTDDKPVQNPDVRLETLGMHPKIVAGLAKLRLHSISDLVNEGYEKNDIPQLLSQLNLAGDTDGIEPIQKIVAKRALGSALDKWNSS